MSGIHSPPPWRCDVTREADRATRIALAGELDLTVAAQFRAELVRAQTESATVTVDLGEIAFVGATGLHALLDADARARRTGTRLLIAHPPAPVQRLFEITGVLDRFDIVGASRPASP